MRKIQAWMNAIRDLLRMLWAAVAALLVIANIQGCTHAPVKTKNEIWLLDSELCALYRVSGPGQEQVIPIKNNPKAAVKFMCIDSDEADDWLEQKIK